MSITKNKATKIIKQYPWAVIEINGHKFPSMTIGLMANDDGLTLYDDYGNEEITYSYLDVQSMQGVVSFDHAKEYL